MFDVNDKVMPLLTYDSLFKKMFGDEFGKERTAALLSIILDIPYKDLLGNIEILNTEKRLNFLKDKKQAVDILVKINLPESLKVNLELNMNNNRLTVIRNYAYIALIFSNLLHNKDSYKKIDNCIQINFNTFFVDNKYKDLIDVYFTQNKHHVKLEKSMEIININIVKCNEIAYNNGDLSKYTEKEKNMIQLAGLIYENKPKKFDKLLEVINMDKKAKESIKKVMDSFTNEEIEGLAYDREEYEKAMIESGIEERVEEASKKALQQGQIQGQIQGQLKEKQTIVKNMLNENVDKETIIKVTGITEKELEKL